MSSSLTTTALSNRLRQIARERPLLDVARFQFLALDKIKLAYGDNWPAHKARIADLAYDFLKRRMHPADVLVRGGDGFVAVFGGTSGREAEIEAIGLTHALNEFFLGDAHRETWGENPRPRLAVSSSNVPADKLVQTMGDVQFISGESAPAPEYAADDVEWWYSPVWDVRREAMSQYWAFAARPGTSERLAGYGFDVETGRPPKLGNVDEAALIQSELALRKLAAGNCKSLVGATVHVSSLMNAESRARLYAAMDQFDHNLLRYKAITVAGITPGFPRIYIEEIVGPLKSRGLSVVLGVAWDEPDFPSLAKLEVAALSVSLTANVVSAHPAVSQTDLLARLRRAIESTHSVKKPLNVSGAIRPALAVRLSAIGVDTIASPLIWPPGPSPKGVNAWSAARLMEPAR